MRLRPWAKVVLVAGFAFFLITVMVRLGYVPDPTSDTMRIMQVRTGEYSDGDDALVQKYTAAPLKQNAFDKMLIFWWNHAGAILLIGFAVVVLLVMSSNNEVDLTNQPMTRPRARDRAFSTPNGMHSQHEPVSDSDNLPIRIMQDMMINNSHFNLPQ